MKLARKFVSLGILVASYHVAAFALESQAGTRGVEAPGEAFPPGSGAYRALIIGINGYRNWGKLRFAERDAGEMRDILVSDYGFEPDNVTTLLGSEATESNIMAALSRELFEVSGEEDRLLIYYAGHGQMDAFTDSGFWIPVEGSLSDETTWISFATLQDKLKADRARPKHILVITDSCFGGALSRSGPPMRNATPGYAAYEEALRALAAKPSRQFIASGGFETVPDKSEFAELLKGALRANEYAAIDLEFLFFEQIYRFLRPKGEQSPVMGRFVTGPGKDGQFVLHRKPRARSSGSVQESRAARLRLESGPLRQGFGGQGPVAASRAAIVAKGRLS